MKEILASEPNPRHMRPIGDVEKVMVPSDLEEATAKATDEFEQAKIDAEIKKKKEEKRIDAEVKAYLERETKLARERARKAGALERNEDDHVTPICVPRFRIEDGLLINEFDDDEITPVEIPRRGFTKSSND